MTELKAGDTFGPYRVEGLVAGGGMGQVYAARHDVYGSVCAMKVLHASLHEQAEWRRRFQAEGLVGARLKHPHVLSAREIVEHEGRLAIIMDLVKGGQTLEKVVSREFPQGLPLGEALRILLAVIQGIDYLHDKGIVHGDLKPENVLIEGEYRRPETWIAKVTDFGTVGLIAHPVVLDGRTAVVATPRYASPEHLRGVDRIEVRSDIYCLGLLLHFLLTGQHASNARTVREAAVFVMRPLSMLRLVDQPEVVQAIFRTATQLDPDARYPNCRELALAVRDALDTLGLRLELEDVAADLATEVDEQMSAAQRQLKEALQQAAEAPPPPPSKEPDDKESDDAEELPTELDPPRPADAPPAAFQPAPAPPQQADPPEEPPAPPSQRANPAEAPPAPPPQRTNPAEGPSAPSAPPPPATSRAEKRTPRRPPSPPAPSSPLESTTLGEDLDTGDSLVEPTAEAPAPREPPRKPPPISRQPASPSVGPLLTGLAIVLLLGLALAVLLY